MWGQPYLAYIAIFFVCLIVFFNEYLSFIHRFKYKTLITTYIGMAVCILMIVGFKIIKKTKKVTQATAVIVNYVE